MIGISIATSEDSICLSTQQGPSPTEIKTSKATTLPLSIGSFSIIQTIQTAAKKLTQEEPREVLVGSVGAISTTVSRSVGTKLIQDAKNPEFIPFMAMGDEMFEKLMRYILLKITGKDRLDMSLSQFTADDYDPTTQEQVFIDAASHILLQSDRISDSIIERFAQGFAMQMNERPLVSFISFGVASQVDVMLKILDSDQRELFIRTFYRHIQTDHIYSMTRPEERYPYLSSITLSRMIEHYAKEHDVPNDFYEFKNKIYRAKKS